LTSIERPAAVAGSGEDVTQIEPAKTNTNTNSAQSAACRSTSGNPPVKHLSADRSGGKSDWAAVELR
jgi:hypothetical protein